jgi:hypothetical protein
MTTEARKYTTEEKLKELERLIAFISRMAETGAMPREVGEMRLQLLEQIKLDVMAADGRVTGEGSERYLRVSG